MVEAIRTYSADEGTWIRVKSDWANCKKKKEKKDSYGGFSWEEDGEERMREKKRKSKKGGERVKSIEGGKGLGG